VTVLAKANLALFALLIAHTVDHAVNQPARDLPVTGGFVAVAGFALVAGSTVLALRRTPSAPLAGVVAGAATAIGVFAIHLAPAWSGAISDPYWDFTANAVSWALMIAPFAGGLALATLGVRELRARPAAVA
jgi:hypothetical protein